MLDSLIVSLRPKQWYKNVVVFAGIVFSLNLLNFQMWLNTSFAFIIFCMLSGAEYLINDVLDMEKDRMHPKKSKRPIASGKLKKSFALFFAAILMILSIVGAFLMNTLFLIISVTYLLSTLAYSMFLKHLVIVDALSISVGFVIRAVAGCLAIEVLISPWLVVCALLLALFLALGKRKHELILLDQEAEDHRKSLADYSIQLLDNMINITSATLIMSYSMYTFLAGNIYMMITIPVAIYGLFRYMFLVQAKNMGGEPEMLFKDRGMLLCMILWVILVILILYGSPEFFSS